MIPPLEVRIARRFAHRPVKPVHRQKPQRIDFQEFGHFRHGLGRGQRRALAEIEESRAAVLEADGHEAAAADIAGIGIDDSQRVADGDRGIDSVAALLENFHAGQ